MTQAKVVPIAASKLTAEVVRLTPALAAEYLEASPDNQRSRNTHRVALYAKQIEQGAFVLSGQPIIFNTKGEMVDGQNRCAAVIMASKPIPAILVVRGIAPGAFVVLDSGRQRTAADVLKIAGFNQCHYLAAAARVYLTYEQTGELHSPYKHGMSSGAILELVQSDDRLSSVVRFYSNQNRWIRIIGIGSALAGLHLILQNRRVPLSQIQEFADALIYGEKLRKSDPVYAYRSALIDSVSNPTHRMQIRVKDARLIKTWNAWFTGNVGPSVTQWHGVRDEYPKLVTRLPR
ncbi:MAG: hypothetical protein KAJ19_18205 [Gammaproteobacteria bacterium]|nr:hypothetical protein [Gammaproteobacteria bacterium]